MSKGNYVQRISQYHSELLRKQKKNTLVFTVSPGSYFLVSDTGVAAVTAEPNLPGLRSDTDLSFLMICSNTRPLTFSRYISASPHPLEEKTTSFDCETQSFPASFGI